MNGSSANECIYKKRGVYKLAMEAFVMGAIDFGSIFSLRTKRFSFLQYAIVREFRRTKGSTFPRQPRLNRRVAWLSL